MKNNAATLQAHIIPRDSHQISRKHISDSALKVMHRLDQGGFQAYLVGGGVRDLLLQLKPKDFDVATDATPEQVRELFRNSRIIGRRFKIVHVRFGREIIEVTTFRGHHDDGEDDSRQKRGSRAADNGMLLRDNVFGNVDEDAVRRDFTINALYYSSKDFTLHDYVGGLADIEHRLIRIIGDPATRYQEDPVRMLRAVRFAAKLDFEIEPATAAPLQKLADNISHVAPARLFDEVIKLLMTGYGLRTYALLKRYHLFAPLFPATADILDGGKDSSAEELIRQGLVNTDARISEDKPVTPAFLYAVILWPPVKQRHLQLLAEGVPEIPALHQAAQEILSQQQQSVSIPRRFSMPMRDIWELQLRLNRTNGRRTEQLLEQRYFRAGYDFLLLREEAGEIEPGLGQWWTAFQEADPQQRQAMLDKAPAKGTRRRKRKPRYHNRKPQ